jgi:hypothetical protein
VSESHVLGLGASSLTGAELVHCTPLLESMGNINGISEALKVYGMFKGLQVCTRSAKMGECSVGKWWRRPEMESAYEERVKNRMGIRE